MGRRRKTGLDCVMLHAALPSHWKVKQIAKLCRISAVEALGYLVRFFCYSAQHHPDGELTSLSDDLIDASIEYPHRAGDSTGSIPFSAALRHNSVGILVLTRHGKTRIHDWDEYNGRYWKELERDRMRKKSAGKSPENPGVFHRNTPPLLSYPTPTPTPTESSPWTAKPKDFSRILQAVERREITTARKNGLLYKVFPSNDKAVIVLDLGDGQSDQIRLCRPADIEGYEFGPAGAGATPAGRQGERSDHPDAAP